MAEAHTFVYAPEIEAGIVSICWHEPERLATIYRELDPTVHFTQPHLRHILEAIDLAYRDLGEVSWQAVIHVLRETGHLEDCGGLDGCNQIYRIEEEGNDLVCVEPDVRVPKPGWAERTEKVFRHYLAMLKTYAVHRNMDPPQPVIRFTGGELYLSLNKTKTKDSDPDLVGHGKVAGLSYKAAAWITTDPRAGDSLRVSLLPTHG